jgi:triosephosphate isomerase
LNARPIWIGTSWKMNKTLAEARAFAERLVAADVVADVRISASSFRPSRPCAK